MITDGHRRLANPIGVPAVSGIFGPIGVGGVFLWTGMMVLALVSLALRYRRSDSDLRHQVKWFLAGVTVLVVGIMVATLTSTTSAWATPPPLIASTIAFAALPASVAIAV